MASARSCASRTPYSPSTQPLQPLQPLQPIQPLQLEDALLTRDEVLAVRLYSGPAYQPINGFLRSLASVKGELRVVVAEDPRVAYTCTVGHICRAIRKLAAVITHEEVREPLYRGVRGVLPEDFWKEDDSGITCAVDMAFMSTSRSRSARVGYISCSYYICYSSQVATSRSVF